VNDITLLWILCALLLFFTLLVSAVKSALSHARLPYLLNIREREQERVDRTIATIERPRLRNTLRLSLIIAHFLMAGLSLLILLDYWPEIKLIYALLLIILVALLVIAFEFLIEGWILHDAEKSALSLAPIGRLLDGLLLPISALMTLMLGEHASEVTLATMTDEELRNWVEIDQPESTLEKGERQMIYSIFHFGDTLAREIMIPRIDLLALDINSTIGEARKAFIDVGHSRVPIFEETIDNVVGLLYAKDLLGNLDDNDTILSQRQLLRTAYFVPEAKKVDELLAEMQSRGVHMTLVVDEYGGVAGVVTLEDIVEEIVGEIRDEYDEIEEQLFQQLGPYEYTFLGRISLDDLNEETGLHLSTENAETLGGFIYGEMGHVPAIGEKVQTDGAIFTIQEVVGRRILKVHAQLIQPEGSEKEEHHANRGD